MRRYGGKRYLTRHIRVSDAALEAKLKELQKANEALKSQHIADTQVSQKHRELLEAFKREQERAAKRQWGDYSDLDGTGPAGDGTGGDGLAAPAAKKQRGADLFSSKGALLYSQHV